ncbi:MAG: histidine-type phosphatase [Bryobacteraceae bacterium]
MKSSHLLGLAAAVLGTLAGAAQPELQYVVIVSRHGVRAPTWDRTRLNQYSAQPWPEWGVAPGELTPHGRALIELLGAYYRSWLAGEHLLDREGCGDRSRIYIYPDKDQRTVETGRAFAESLLPGCGLETRAEPDGGADPLFSGAGTPDPALAAEAVRARLGADSGRLLADHKEALDALRQLLTGGKPVPKALDPAEAIGVAATRKSFELEGPFAVASTLSEDLLLEYAEGMEGAELGWGRLTRENLFRVLGLHRVYADLMRRTPYLARARGSNLLAHILRSMEQAVSGGRVAGAVGPAGDAVLMLCGHDTNLSNLAGMLGLSWSLPGYQPDETPPGGALIFALWRDPGDKQYFVRARFVAQTLDQMRHAEQLTVAAPPASQELPVPGCESTPPKTACPWERFQIAIRKAIAPEFTTLSAPN